MRPFEDSSASSFNRDRIDGYSLFRRGAARQLRSRLSRCKTCPTGASQRAVRGELPAEAALACLGESVWRLRLDEQCDDLPVSGTDVLLDLQDVLLDLRHAQLVRELEAERHQDLIRRKLRAQQPVHARNGRILC